MNKFCISVLFVLICGGEILFAQRTVISYKDTLWLQLRPVDIYDDIFMNQKPNVIYFEDAKTCDYLYGIFEKMQQDHESKDTILRNPEVHRQITICQSDSPSYRLSYDSYRMALNGNPVRFDFFLQHLFEKIIELNREDSVSNIQESIMEYHKGNRYPMIETIVQELVDKEISEENLKVDIGLCHIANGRMDVMLHVRYNPVPSGIPEITAMQIVSMDTCQNRAVGICNCYPVYPMYKGPLSMKWRDYLLLANKYPLHVISSIFSATDNDYMLELSPPYVEITPLRLNAILSQLDVLISPSLFIIPIHKDMSLPQPQQIEFHISLSCQFY